MPTYKPILDTEWKTNISGFAWHAYLCKFAFTYISNLFP